MAKLAVATTAAYSIIFGLSAVATSTAFAKPQVTPFGVADDKCVYEIPKGAQIDLATGDVSLKGTRIAHHERCANFTASPTIGTAVSARGVAPSTSLSGWLGFSQATATTISGLTQFDELDAEWVVPPNPVAAGGTVQFFFPSVTNSTGSCPTCAIIQPVLDWSSDGQQYWQIRNWVVWGCDSNGQNCGVGKTPAEAVPSGHTLYGSVRQIAGTPPAAADTWYMSIYDFNSDAESTGSVSIPNAWPKFKFANAGVFEVLGVLQCSQLPGSGIERFTLEILYEGGPKWSSYNDVMPSRPNAPQWFGMAQSMTTPNCTIAATVSGSDTTITWKTH